MNNNNNKKKDDQFFFTIAFVPVGQTGKCNPLRHVETAYHKRSSCSNTQAPVEFSFPIFLNTLLFFAKEERRTRELLNQLHFFFCSFSYIFIDVEEFFEYVAHTTLRTMAT